MNSLIVGIGNDILSDDSVGIKIARELKLRLGDSIDVTEAHTGGLRLMDRMVGYDTAYLIDAMVTGKHAPGTMHELSLSDVLNTRNTVSTHDGSLAMALEMGRSVGLRLPSKLRIWGIEAVNVLDFSEELTPELQASFNDNVSTLLDEISSDSKVNIQKTELISSNL